MFPFRSIRVRLTLWYVLTLVAILAASGIFWQIYLNRTLVEAADGKLERLSEEVTIIYLAGHDNLLPGDSCRTLEDYSRRFNWGEYVQVLDARGKIDCSSGNLQDFKLPLSAEALAQVGSGQRHFETLTSLTPTVIRLLSIPVVQEGELAHIIQVADGLGPMGTALEKLRLILLVLSPLFLIGLCCGGWFLAGRALAPVSRISRAVREIKADSLHQRLPVGEVRDEISELAETFNSMLARLEDSFRKVKQFSGDASHELRTPLAILRGETEVALRWAKDPEELRLTLESNMEEIDRMGRIIEDLLTLAKSEAGQISLKLTRFSLTDMLQDLYMQGNVLGEPKEIAVTLDLRVTEDIQIRGDHLQLHRMLLNLLANAIKYTPQGGQVEIALVAHAGEAVVAFTDTGYGIAEEHLARIFDRFYRIDEARNRAEGGTGLGLSIVKWIVDAHEGRIDIESTPGEGSIFTVSLPLAGPVERTSNPS